MPSLEILAVRRAFPGRLLSTRGGRGSVLLMCNTSFPDLLNNHCLLNGGPLRSARAVMRQTLSEALLRG
jgi:hypothetical protein